MAVNPTFTFVTAYYTNAYNTFLGDPTNYNQISTWSAANYNFTADNKWSWWNAANSTKYAGELGGMCCAGAMLLQCISSQSVRHACVR